MATKSKVDALKPGQNVQCTVEKSPRAEGALKTIERLMRLDPENKKALRRAQVVRDRRLNVYNRGNRDWTSREKPARVVGVRKGVSWTLPYNVSLASDLRSVEAFLTLK
ncbi:MAG: hypothetical protein HUU18_05955 [Phycisphaerales bacterium]|jgi:hypothetical protein|nr:hypothetical protein [Phycisphaerales bacterium]NUQ67807.1 hypothetical protein [Phycisphaerales bacterium]